MSKFVTSAIRQSLSCAITFIKNGYDMNELMIFEDALFGQVRTIMSASNEPLFCLSDVCRALEMKRFRIERLDKDVISNHPLQTAGGLQQVTFVNEDGL